MFKNTLHKLSNDPRARTVLLKKVATRLGTSNLHKSAGVLGDIWDKFNDNAINRALNPVGYWAYKTFQQPKRNAEGEAVNPNIWQRAMENKIHRRLDPIGYALWRKGPTKAVYDGISSVRDPVHGVSSAIEDLKTASR